jgi:hypothetical protein
MVSQLTRSVLVAQQLDGGSYANVQSTDTNELLTNTLSSNRAMTVSTRQTVADATGWFMLIDLSNTTTWPHVQTTGIVIDHLSLSVLAGASSTGTLDLGVVTELDAENGSVDFFWHSDWVGESGGGAGPVVYSSEKNFTPNGVDCSINAGVATRLLSSEGVTADVAIKTSSTLGGVTASTTPGVGDIVMRIVNSDASTVKVSVTIGYHSI